MLYCFSATNKVENTIAVLILEDENSLGLCKGDQYVKGQWVLDSKPREKSFFCCSNGDMGGGNPSCSGTHENYGRKHFSYEDLVVAPGSACICDLMAETRDSVSERESYDWVPESCRWEKTFTGSQFCKVLGKRRLLMIGDSLVHQLASTLVNILKTRDAPCLDQISFGVSNHLKYEANHPPHVTRFDGNQNIRHFFSQNSGADICLINAGAHLEDGGDLFDIWETISPWLKEYKVSAIAVDDLLFPLILCDTVYIYNIYIYISPNSVRYRIHIYVLPN